ncbi:MAG: glycosyltransferase [Verrucomicrobia bacterium]|nr:glycosyltransferase [Verrucomicrobiota bacterium]
MILNLILGSLALLSLALTLWQWLVARRFPLHQRVSQPSPLTLQHPVTLLKPLKGCDTATEDCLRSWFAQHYAGSTQILFGVADGEDPVCGIVRKLLQEFPGSDAQLVVCGPLLGANAKVSKLVELERMAKHEIIIVSDADVRVPPDFLANFVGPLCAVPLSGPMVEGSAGVAPARVAADVSRRHLQCGQNAPTDVGGYAKMVNPAGCGGSEAGEQACGLVCCFYRLANPKTLAMQWEAVAINADFWSQVLQSRSLKPIDFALGAVMATRRQHFRDMVECRSAPMGWVAVWKHQLRWARTIRVCQPVPYFFSLLSNATIWPLLWLIVRPAPQVATCALVCLLVRVLTALNLQHRLTRTPPPYARGWLVPIKDLLQAAIWLLAFMGNRIEWRGQRMRLRRDGTLVRG